MEGKEIRMPYEEHEALLKRSDLLREILNGEKKTKKPLLVLRYNSETEYVGSWRNQRGVVLPNIPTFRVANSGDEVTQEIQEAFYNARTEFRRAVGETADLVKAIEVRDQKIEKLEDAYEDMETRMKDHRLAKNWAVIFMLASFVGLIFALI